MTKAQKCKPVATVKRGFLMYLIFTALHAMQMRSSDENSVCPSICLSVRPSVCQTCDFDKMEGRSVQIFISYERSFSLVF